MKSLSEEVQRLHGDVNFLTSVKPARNYNNIDILNKVAAYIMGEFEKLDCEVRYQIFHVDGVGYRNVIANFGPEGGPVIVVGAHYDVAGDQPGADDNASAVAGLLEIARKINDYKGNLNNRIELVGYCLEEPPYFGTENMGSAVHAKSIAEGNINIKGMLCLEMIGYFSELPNSQNFPDDRLRKLYPDKGNFIIVVGKKGQEVFIQMVQNLMQKGGNIDVQSIALPSSDILAELSDHRNYWKYNFNAVMINDTSFLRNPNYHQKTDTIETLNFEKMAEVIKGVFNVIINL